MKKLKALAVLVPLSMTIGLLTGVPAAVADDPVAPINGRAAVDTSTFPITNLKIVDDQAGKETQSLFAYLKGLGNSGHMLFGHEEDLTASVVTTPCAGTGGVTSRSDTCRATNGAFPGVDGIDFTNDTAFVNRVKTSYRAGSIITLSDHLSSLHNSTGAGGNYGVVTNPLNPVEMILPGGPNHQNLVTYLDNVAARAAQLVDDSGNPIPVVYRPWHEHDGDWFWWTTQNATEGEIAELFRFTVHYLRDVKGVHNFLYAFSPNGHFENEAEYLYGYPGDEYIDVMGLDTYDDVPAANPDWAAQTLKDLQIAVTYANKTGKIAALTETGVRYDAGSHGWRTQGPADYPLDWWTTLVDMIQNDPIAKQTAFFLVWANFGTTQFWVPFKGQAQYGDHHMLPNFVQMYNKDSVVFSDRTGDYTHLLGADTDHAVKLPAAVTIHTPEFKDEVSGTRTVYVEANTRTVPCVYATLGAACEDIPSARIAPTQVSVKLGDLPEVAATAPTTSNGFWTATIDSTLVPDGRTPIVANVSYTSGLIANRLYAGTASSQHDVFVRNTPAAANPDPYLIDDFESYDSTDDNRTDLERAWWRSGNEMNGLRLRNSDDTYPADHWLSNAWNDKTLDTGAVLRIKYDVVNKNSSSDPSSLATKSYPAPYRDWSAAKSLSLRIQPDGKSHQFIVRITTGTGNANTFDLNLNTAGVAYGYDPELVAPQLVKVPISEFKSLTGNASPTTAQLATVRSTAIRILQNPAKGRMAGLNALEYYLVDDLKVSTASATDQVYLDVLQIAIDEHALFEEQEARYTPASYAPLAAALAKARGYVTQGAVSQLAFETAVAGLKAAAAGLVEAINTSAFEELVAAAQNVLDNPGSYVSENLPALQAAVDAARVALDDPGLTPEQVVDAMVALTDALNAVLPLGDHLGLDALILVVSGLDGSRYTPTSYAPVSAALTEAVAVNANAQASSYQVDEAYTALHTAVSGLTLRPAKAGLKSTIDVAKAVLAKADLYYPASIAGLADAVAAAQAVYDDANASGAEVTSAQSQLVALIAAAKLKPVATGTSPTSGVGTTLDPATVASPNAALTIAKPKVAGAAKVGKKVKAVVAKPAGKPKLTYQWFAGSKKIAKATKATYKVTAKVKGKRLFVKVTATKAGYAKVTKTSAKTAKVMSHR